jgi:two-component system chemotaxis response regulator CheB
MQAEPIKIIVVDDSVSVRNIFKHIFSDTSEFDVIGTAADPFEAVEIMKKELPDVIILDVKMPKMNGITFLKKIMAQHPVPVIICSGYTKEDEELAQAAIKYGAFDIISKPKMGTPAFIKESSDKIKKLVKKASISMDKNNRRNEKSFQKKFFADAVINYSGITLATDITEKIICIGASTGGTVALKKILPMFPKDSPGILIVQHLPETFTGSFAESLNSVCSLKVSEARDNELIRKGHVLVAPGNQHMLVKYRNNRYYVRLIEGPLVCRHRPSADVLFRSAAKYAGPNAVGLIMTGMGDDGARGITEMKNAGAFTIAQDESTCVVFGMPQVAISMNAIQKVVPLEKIAETIISYIK